MDSTPTSPALPPRSTRLLDPMRERLRCRHYSLSIERSHVHWVPWFVRFHVPRHPRDMGAPEVEQFLCWLANERRASLPTHKQALAGDLHRQLAYARTVWTSDRASGRPGVETPPSVAKKYPRPARAARVSGCFLRTTGRTIQELLGDSHVDTTTIYTHVLDSGTGVLGPLDEGARPA